MTTAEPVYDTDAEERFGAWVILELMGHRRLAGYLTEQVIAGHGFLRLDVPGPDGTTTSTQLYATSAVYCITPTTEDIARRVAKGNRPEPVTAWELARVMNGDDDDEGYGS